MADTRTEFLEEKLFSDVCKKLKVDKLPKSIIFRDPYCVGYSPAAPFDVRTKAIMRSLIEHSKTNPNHKVELFLSVKEKDALEALLDVQENDEYVNKAYLHWLVEQGVRVTYSADYSQDDEYKKAEAIFNKELAPKLVTPASPDAERTKEYDALSKDIVAAKKRPKLKLLSEDVIKAHVIQDTKYVISWLDQGTEKSEEQVTVVLHEGFFNLMYYSVQHAAELGYRANSLILQKLDDRYFENRVVNEEVDKDVAKEAIHESHAAIEKMAMRAMQEMYGKSDPVNAGLFYGAVLKSILFATAPIPIPAADKKPQVKPSSAPRTSLFFADSGTSPKHEVSRMSADSSSEELTPNVSPAMSSANSSDDDASPSSSPKRESIAPAPSALRGALQLTVLPPPPPATRVSPSIQLGIARDTNEEDKKSFGQ